MKCKNCIFYTGIECHGHGDFWGSCKLINKINNHYDNIIYNKNRELENILKQLGYKDNYIFKSKFISLRYICDNETNCKYKEFIYDIYSRGIINENEYKKYYNMELEQWNNILIMKGNNKQ